MKNRKYNLLPYETIVKAAAGEPEAVNTVIQTYTGYIKYLSYFQGSINDDIQDYIKAQLMESLPKFRFDRWQVAKTEKALKDKLRVLDGFSCLCCWAAKRAQSDKPLTLSIQYGMLRDRVCFSLDLSGITEEIRVGVRVLYSNP